MKRTALKSSMAESSSMDPGDGIKRIKRKMAMKKQQRSIGRHMKDVAKKNSGDSKQIKKQADVVDSHEYAKPVRAAIGKMKDKVKAKGEDIATGYRKRRSLHGKKSSGSDDMEVCGPGGCKMGKSAPGLK